MGQNLEIASDKMHLMKVSNKMAPDKKAWDETAKCHIFKEMLQNGRL